MQVLFVLPGCHGGFVFFESPDSGAEHTVFILGGESRREAALMQVSFCFGRFPQWVRFFESPDSGAEHPVFILGSESRREAALMQVSLFRVARQRR